MFNDFTPKGKKIAMSVIVGTVIIALLIIIGLEIINIHVETVPVGSGHVLNAITMRIIQ